MSETSKKLLYRSPLKWAGGKSKLVANIATHLPKRGIKRLVEPFVGGGSVFLNLSYSELLLVDSNPDLIGLFHALKHQHDEFVLQAQQLFTAHYNQAEMYYQLRAEFNNTPASMRRWVLFLYLNRHGYNGLCRYNQKGAYNVPFGKYKKPYFPEQEMRYCMQKIANAELFSGDFSRAFEHAKKGDVVYCDPPYLPIDKTASFTAYSGMAFTLADQKRLADLAQEAKNKGVSTIISNNYLKDTLNLYHQADKIVSLKVARNISCKGDIRKPIKELMAIYKA